jgi:hypothetical protein
VVDLDHVVPVLQQTLSARRQVVERRGRERDVIDPRGQPEAAACAHPTVNP